MPIIHNDRNELPLSGKENIIAQAPYRVLVVDDMETNCQLIKGSIQPSRYVVVEATDGKGALEWCRASPGKKRTSGSGGTGACNG